MNLRDLFGVRAKLKESIFKNSNPISYNQNMDFVNRMDQNVAKYWYPNEKIVVVPVCLNGRYCSSGCVDIASN